MSNGKLALWATVLAVMFLATEAPFLVWLRDLETWAQVTSTVLALALVTALVYAFHDKGVQRNAVPWFVLWFLLMMVVVTIRVNDYLGDSLMVFLVHYFIVVMVTFYLYRMIHALKGTPSAVIWVVLISFIAYEMTTVVYLTASLENLEAIWNFMWWPVTALGVGIVLMFTTAHGEET